MKKLILSRFVLIALVIGSPAVAADMPVKYKAPLAVLAPAYSWTGFYLGGHVGGGWSRGDADAIGQAAGIGSYSLPMSFAKGGSGLIGGAQIGYNWQFAPSWVVGVEADATWAHMNGSSTISPIPPAPFFILPAASSVTMSRTVNWLGSLRTRFGYSADRVLLYVTGGLAVGGVNHDANTILGGLSFPASFSNTNLGWVVGGGVEYALPSDWGNWTVRGEYLYYALRDGGLAVGTNPGAVGTTTDYNWNDANAQVVRFGLNYKFGGPVVAKY